MIKWISHIHLGKVFLIGFLYLILSTAIRMIEIVWTMNFYADPAYRGVWNPLMMPEAGPPTLQFRMVHAVLSFAVGISLAVIYYYVRDYLPKGYWRRATYFADLMVATSLVFFTFPVFLLFHVPVLLLVSWFLSTFALLVGTSLIIVRIIQ